MTFKNKIHNPHDVRIRKWFAILPVTIVVDGYKITKWLEFVKVKQEYCITYFEEGRWDNEAFL